MRVKSEKKEHKDRQFAAECKREEVDIGTKKERRQKRRDTREELES